MKIIYFGTPPFAAEILAHLLEHQIQVAAIVTKPDQPRGRSQKLAFSAVKELAQNLDIPLFQPEKASDPAIAEKLSAIEADLFVVVAYGEIIKENLLKMPRLGCINVHPSLLPKYRGAAPIQFALLKGDKETGVTIMEMAEQMDAGDIIAQEIVPITEETTLDELERKLCAAGARKLTYVIKELEKGPLLKTPQDHSKATYVKKIDPSMAEIDWKEQARVLHNRIRAFNPRPGAWCQVQMGGKSKRLKILKSRLLPNQGGAPGKILQYDLKKFTIACGEEALQILELQLEGKKKMDIEDFLRGHPTKINLI